MIKKRDLLSITDITAKEIERFFSVAAKLKKEKPMFALGEKGKRSLRRFRYKLKNNKSLYLELKNFRFSELIYDKEEENNLVCPSCNKADKVRRVYSTFKAIFDDKSKRAPRPGDELQYHLDYKKMKDEEMASAWVGQDYLNQYFND